MPLPNVRPNELYISPQSVDHTDIRRLNLKWLRSEIGIVSQEPVLFDCSIKDNIIYGLSEEEIADITIDRVESAAKSANIHHFISTLPKVSMNLYI